MNGCPRQDIVYTYAKLCATGDKSHDSDRFGSDIGETRAEDGDVSHLCGMLEATN